MKLVKSSVAPLLVMLFLVAGVASAAPTFTILDIGPVGPAGSVTDINDSGQVVGRALFPGFTYYHAYVWSGGVMTDLGTLGYNYDSRAEGINNSTDVVGYYRQNPPGDNDHRAVIWSGGIGTDIGTLGGAEATASYVSDSGQIVGTSVTSAQGGPWHGFLLDAGVWTDLGALPNPTPYPWYENSSNAYSMNSQGQIVGDSYVDRSSVEDPQHAVLFFNGWVQDLGTLGGQWSSAFSINEKGDIVGYASDADEAGRAFIWTDGNMTELGTLGGSESAAYDIDELGQIVGWADVGGDLQRHAFLWEGGLMTDLNTLIPDNTGWLLSEARALNDIGWIAGIGTYQGARHGFILTPVGAVPAPGALILGFFGVGIVTLSKRRFRSNN